MMNPKLNYSKLISVQPPEVSRVASSIFPTNASDVTTKNTNVIDFNFPAVSYADMNSAYLKFKAEIKTDVVGDVTGTYVHTGPVHTDIATVFDGGAISLIDSVYLYNSENQVISYIQDFPAYALALLKERGIEYAEVAKNLMGWNEVFHEDYVTDNANGLESAGAKVSIQVVSNNLDNNRAQIPGAMLYSTSNPTTASKIYGTSVEFAIPAFFFSGLFSQGNYIPLAYMGSKSSALRLQIRTSTSERALLVTAVEHDDTLHTFAGTGRNTSASTFAAAAKPYARIYSPEFVLDYVTVDAATDSRIKDAIYKEGIRLQFTDYSTITDTAMQAGILNHNSNQTRTAMSLKNITCQFRKNQVDSYLYPNVTGTGRFTLNSIQFKVGSRYWPNSALELSSDEFNGAAYAELVKRSGSLSKPNSASYVSKFHDSQKCGFELSFDFDNKRISDSSFDNNNLGLNGLSLANGSNSIVGMFRRSSGTDALKITMIFATDNVLILENNRATVLESRA